MRVLHRDGPCYEVDMLDRNASATATLICRWWCHNGDFRNCLHTLVCYVESLCQTEQHCRVTADLLQYRLQGPVAIQFWRQTCGLSPHLCSPYIDHGEGRIDDRDGHFATICQRDLLPWHAGGQERSTQRSIWFQVLQRNTRSWAWDTINAVVALNLGLPLTHRHMRNVTFARVRSQHVGAGHGFHCWYQSLINGKRSHRG